MQAALSATGGDGSSNTIYLAAGTYNVSRTLVYDSKGSAESIQLIGCGSSQTIIDGGDNVRVFHFMKNGANAERIEQAPYPQLLLREMSIINGNDRGDSNGFGRSGGGILIERFHTEIYNASFRNNRTQFTGGSIEGPANLIVSNSQFSETAAGRTGGSVNSCGSVYISDSSFSGINGAALTRGICLDQDYSTLPVVVKKSLFTGNLTGLYIIGGYGASFGSLGQVIIEDSVFSNNNPRAIDLVNAGNLRVERSKFEGNGPWDRVGAQTSCVNHRFSCESGGAIFDRTFNGQWIISETDFIRNFALDYGGAIDRGGSGRCVDGQEQCDPSRVPSFPTAIILDSVRFEGNRSHRGAAISIARTDAYPGFLTGNLKLNRVDFINNIGVAPVMNGTQTPIDEAQTSVVVAGGDISNCLGSQSGNIADRVFFAKGNLSNAC